MSLPRILLALLVLGCALCVAQTGPAMPTVDNNFVQKQFGQTCTVISGQWPLTADLDGDGIEDVVIPARCTNPLEDQSQDNYRVLDPYNNYFGYGDPKVTSAFSSEDPMQKGLSLLVIHGEGADAWRAATPKAKFLLINLPYKQIHVKRLSLSKKKTIMAIYVEESGGDQMVSTVYFDGKKYKYAPLGSSME